MMFFLSTAPEFPTAIRNSKYLPKKPEENRKKKPAR
jgi:hypothetical protein